MTYEKHYLDLTKEIKKNKFTARKTIVFCDMKFVITTNIHGEFGLYPLSNKYIHWDRCVLTYVKKEDIRLSEICRESIYVMYEDWFESQRKRLEQKVKILSEKYKIRKDIILNLVCDLERDQEYIVYSDLRNG